MNTQVFVSWNVRGSSEEVNRANIRAMVFESKASCLCIQETKCKRWDVKSLSGLGMGDQIKWIEVPSDGLAGGLISVWDDRVFDISFTSSSSS